MNGQPRHDERSTSAAEPVLSPTRYNIGIGAYPQEERGPVTNGTRAPIAIDVLHTAQSAQKDTSAAVGHDPLTLHTTNLSAPHVAAPLSSATDFEESPVLGMPGSFMMTPTQETPPIGSTQEVHVTPPLGSNQEAQDTSAPQTKEVTRGELLQPVTFQPFNKNINPVGTLLSDDLPSELGVRESIPIMLGGEELSPGFDHSNDQQESRQSPRESMGAQRWRVEPLDASGTISYIDEDDSPIDPFPNHRETLRPQDSASNVGFYSAPAWKPEVPPIPNRGALTLDSEAYSVINKVLNLYHKSPKITAEVAHESRQKIQRVSPVVAQHTDWGSKESTETYLARLLSDANGAEQPRPEDGGASAEQRAPQDASSHSIPSVNYHELDLDPIEPHTGGTAIIFPSESRRYSRGSHSSVATTIHDDASRAESFSGNHAARDRSPDAGVKAPQRLAPTTFVPAPPPKDANPSPRVAQPPRASPQPSFGPLLPEIQATGEGLGLELQAGQQQPNRSRQQRKQPPPRRHKPAAAAMCRTPGAVFPSNEAYANWVDGAGPPDDPERKRWYPVPTEITSERESRAPTLNDGTDAGNAEQASIAATEGTLIEQAAVKNEPNAETLTDGAADKTATGKAAVAGHPAAFPGETEEAITKRLQRRFRILEEMYTTEGGYMSDLMVISQIWLDACNKIDVFTPQERQIVFCNVAELEALSAQITIDLKKAVEPIRVIRGPENPEDMEPIDGGYGYIPMGPEELNPADQFDNCTLDNDDKTSVGYVMKQYLPTIEELYTKYLLNHEKANKIIVSRSKEQDPNFIAWQATCHSFSKDITDAWDLDSLLVKPVQRLMKYPLLLQSLQDSTPPTHDDFKDIDIARKGIVDISLRINEKKKRMETLRQATKEGKKGKKKGFPGIDIVRALGGKEKIKAIANEAFVDPVYDEHSQKFGGHFFQIQILINDFEKYREELTTCFVHLNIVALNIVALLEDQHSSNPEIESAWRHNAMALLELRNVLLEDHVSLFPFV